MGAEAVKLLPVQSIFGLRAAGRLMLEIVAPWVQDLGLLIESIDAGPPAGAEPDWQPGAVLRLPFSRKLCGENGMLSGAPLMALADTAMMFACAAASNGYRPMIAVDQTTHFLRPVNFDVLADARVVRNGRSTTFIRVSLIGASDRKPGRHGVGRIHRGVNCR